MNEKELLQKRICDFELKVPLEIKECFQQVLRELKEFGINHKGSLFISDEWFVAESSQKIAIPFYLCDLRLKALEKKIMGRVEGNSRKEILMLIRHEYAHVLDNASYLKKSKRRQRLFGLSSQRYPNSYLIKENINTTEYVKHFDDVYASSHPEEDWAETIAVLLNKNIPWKRKYKKTKAFDKLSLAEELITNLDCDNKRKDIGAVDHYKDNEMTLNDFYEMRLSRLAKINIKFPIKTKKTNIRSVLAKEKKSIIASVSRNLRVESEYVNRIVENTALTMKKSIYSSLSEHETKKYILNSFLKKGRTYFQKEGRRITM